MYEAIREKLLSYILENRPDLQKEITLLDNSEDLLDQLMSGTKSLIKQMLSQGANRNKIQWVCLDKLISKLSKPKILIVKDCSTCNGYRSLGKDINLTLDMIGLMSVGTYAFMHREQTNFTLN